MSLITLNKQNDVSFIDSIFSNEIIVYEDIQGSKIFANWDGSKFTIKPKSISADPINMIDLAMQKYYNNAVTYLNSLDERIKSLLDKKWWFCFEYFPDEQPANIEYYKNPKNNLVLTSICKSGKFNYEIDELEEYSRLLDVDCIPLLFKGKLTNSMKEAIMYFLNTSEDDLEYVFGDKNFSFFFYKLLSPTNTSSYLMEEGKFNDNIEKLIIKSKNSTDSFQILNPLYKRVSDANSTEFVEVYSLILVNFLNFSQNFYLKDIKIKGDTRDELYIDLICKLFNEYINNVGDDILDFDFVIPKFFDKEKFKINRDFIKNKTTIQIIDSHPKIEYVFKILLGSFSKRRKKPIGVFTEKTTELFNTFVKNISNYIDECQNKSNEIELAKQGLVDFGDWFDIKYDKDSEDQVYPDVYNEFEKGSVSSSDKKKKDLKGGVEEVPEITSDKKNLK